MKILQFMTQETDVSKQQILFLAGIAGVANSLLLIILNEAATALDDGLIEAQLLAQYIIAFILFIYAQRMSQRKAVIAVEHALQKVRIRLADKVRRCDLRTIEEIGDIDSYASLTQGANTISQAVMYLVTGVEALLVLIFASLYLLWLSPASFVVAMILISITIVLLVHHYKNTFDELSVASHKEGLFFAHFMSILKGFKQLKINQRESDGLFHHTKELALEASDLKGRSNVRLLEDILLTNVSFYLLLLLVVFILPNMITENEENLFQVIATILFMMEPVYVISSAIPNLSKTNVAINGLYRLEERLDSSQQPLSDLNAPNTSKFHDFQQIELVGADFAYRNEQGHVLFQTEPVDLTLKRGELVFITGGNGSGKSTLLKLLTGLYQSENGHIQIDGDSLSTDDYPAYRELFSVVFNDFHLFQRLYDEETIDAAAINQWLHKLDLSQKTDFADNRFTQTDLSTGQRKRLAFIIALMQNRPVLILDELTADQDPDFRKKFQTQILPELKASGKTIIAVSHDQEHFSTADRIFQMDSGRLKTPGFH
ncbi:MAG: cyclic peptide export ABC transporter [Thiolinea sp.]